MKLLLHALLVFLLAMPLFGRITENQLQGHWGFGYMEKYYTRASVASYLPNGLYEEDGTINIRFGSDIEKNPFQVRGTWKLDDGILIITVLQSNAPDFIKVGDIEKYEIKKATATEMTYITVFDGKAYISKRTHKP